MHTVARVEALARARKRRVGMFAAKMLIKNIKLALEEGANS